MKRVIAPEDCLLKLMGDTGGNFFKYCMQVIDMRKVLKEKRARACLSDGLFSHEYNENGVNKIIILAIVAKEGVSECYDLVSKVPLWASRVVKKKIFFFFDKNHYIYMGEGHFSPDPLGSSYLRASKPLKMAKNGLFGQFLTI